MKNYINQIQTPDFSLKRNFINEIVLIVPKYELQLQQFSTQIDHLIQQIKPLQIQKDFSEVPHFPHCN